ncbi:MAG: DKNYY domain-containing protein [Leptospiraceae bacterium]|nr:DKNYY domain-containing protein [Leptospiraceae bacterium]
MKLIKTLLIVMNIFIVHVQFSCTSPGSLIDKNVSKNHYYSSFKTSVIFATMGGDCFSIGCKEIEGSDIDTFKPLNNFYGSDKNYVYYKDDKIAGADMNTFRPLSEIYAVDKEYVYFGSKKISGENSGDFKTVDGAYAIGKKVYWIGRVLPSADPNTFETATIQNEKRTGYYGKDKNAIFCLEKQLSNQPTLFKQLHKNGYFSDRNKVYYIYSCESFDADPKTFEFIYKKDGSESHYGKDFKRVFLLLIGLHKTIEGADPKTFEVLLCSNAALDFAKDKNHVYKNGVVIKEAHPNTFEFPAECK